MAERSGLFYGCVALALVWSHGPAHGVDLAPAVKDFRDAQAGISLNYPQGWEPALPSGRNTRVLLNAKDGSEAVCAVSVRSDSGPGIDAYDRQWVEDKLSRTYPNVAVQDVRSQSLGAHRFAVTDFLHDFPEATGITRKARTLIADTLRNGDRFTILCSAPADTFPAARTAFDLMTASLKLQ